MSESLLAVKKLVERNASSGGRSVCQCQAAMIDIEEGDNARESERTRMQENADVG